MLIAIAFSIALVRQAATAMVADRPLTWDWQGTIPVDLAQEPSEAQVKLFDDMRAGDYFRASSAAMAHLRLHRNDLVDVWIILESARKRGAAQDLVAQSAGLLGLESTTATRLLRLRAVNMACKQFLAKDGKISSRVKQMEDEIPLAEKLVRSDASVNVASLAAIVASLDSDAAANRVNAKDLLAHMPNSYEVRLLYVRALLKGGIAATVSHGNPPVPVAQKDLRLHFVDPKPEMAKALQELAQIDANFGRRPLGDYYRAAAYSMQAQFANPNRSIVPPDLQKADWHELEAKAQACAKAFLVSGKDFPRMTAIARKYLDGRGWGVFFPWTDE